MIELRNKRTGQLLYLDGAGFGFVKQIGDIQDLTKASTSFSTSFKIPASFSNIGVLKGLGLIGSTSDIPYRSRLWDLLVDDIPIIVDAELIVQDMSDGMYNAHLKQGVVSFFKDIQADTISEAIDLSELEHENNIFEILDSWQRNKPYKYIVADYNAAQLTKENGVTNLSEAGIHPSVNVKWLWDKIFSTYGWTYELTPDLSDLWLTYPTAIGYETSTDLLLLDASVKPNWKVVRREENVTLGFNDVFRNPNYFAASTTLSDSYRCLVSAFYEIEFNIEDQLSRLDEVEMDFNIENEPGSLGRDEIIASKTYWIHVMSQGWTEIKAGVKLRLFMPANWNFSIQTKVINHIRSSDVGYQVNEGSLKIYETDVSQISFVEAFMDFKVADFIKEWTVRLCASYVTDVKKKHIRFMTMDERLNAPRINVSKYFLDRTKETYSIAGYARQSVFTLNYHDDLLSKYADASFRLMNETLERSKVVFFSQFTAPLNRDTQYTLSGSIKALVPTIPMYDIKVTETKKEDSDEQGDIKITYEPLDTRFYVIKEYIAEGGIFIKNVEYLNAPIATTAGASLKYFIDTYWANVGRILNAPLVQNVEFNLHAFNMDKIPLDKVVELEQEGSRYLVSRVEYKHGSLVTAELIKIR